MNADFVTPSEKKKLISDFNELFGIQELPYMLIETGKQKIRAFSGSASKDDLKELDRLGNVEIIGLYIAKKDASWRLSFDAPMMLKDQIKKSVVELTEDEVKLWMKGHVLDRALVPGVYIVKHKEDFLGCAFANATKLFNYVPRERQSRSKN